ncbi:hypothetical protein ACIBAH_22455 [Streptomyces sp. NPDC051445]|uniref:hypothetical protein n=1 Tax=Streptomyces sp. NPDC051445 TaxID=3365653 RepID=UPI0037AA953C
MGNLHRFVIKWRGAEQALPVTDPGWCTGRSQGPGPPEPPVSHYTRQFHARGAVPAALGLLPVPVVSHIGLYVAVLASLAMMLNGFGVALFNVFAVSLRQAIPPEHQIGAVTASCRLVALGTLPLGAVVGGAQADALAPDRALWVVGLSYLASRSG